MARAPSSSYSFFETHIFLKVSSEARIEPLGRDRHVTYDRQTGALPLPLRREELFLLHNTSMLEKGAKAPCFLQQKHSLNGHLLSR